MLTAEEDAELLEKARQIKEELERKKVELTPNQRKKARRKLAKLFTSAQDVPRQPTDSTDGWTSTCSVHEIEQPASFGTSCPPVGSTCLGNNSLLPAAPLSASGRLAGVGGSCGPSCQSEDSRCSAGNSAPEHVAGQGPKLSAREKRIPRWRLKKLSATASGTAQVSCEGLEGSDPPCSALKPSNSLATAASAPPARDVAQGRSDEVVRIPDMGPRQLSMVPAPDMGPRQLSMVPAPDMGPRHLAFFPVPQLPSHKVGGTDLSIFVRLISKELQGTGEACGPDPMEGGCAAAEPCQRTRGEGASPAEQDKSVEDDKLACATTTEALCPAEAKPEASNDTDAQKNKRREVCRADLSHETSIISTELAHSCEEGQEGKMEAIEEGPPPKKRKKQEQFTHGNYHGYYGYRLGQGEEIQEHYYEDARLKLFQSCWFQGRDVLDVGCNEGIITIEVCRRFGTQSITGVDIDSVLIDKANVNLLNLRSSVQKQLATPDASMAGRWAEVRGVVKSLKNVKFVNEDWSLNQRQRRQQMGGSGKSKIGRRSFGTIMCLSVTKWVHLNGGDDALRALFNKFWESLEPGGFLVLEPQPWSSYKTAIHKRQTAAVPFRQIEQLQLRPEHFIQHLTEEMGFSLVMSLNRGSKGFDRPMFVLQRPEVPSLN